ncbi:MAG TPA: NAD(P)/FAD-dependent oxidoreductase [Burkholderiaceae bacterium]|jgi:L-2-hydroxyglutarate oxidase LhgO
MESADVVVIGAGVVGLAVARALALSGRETLVLEREAGIGQGISSRSSEVMHAGLYYPTGSLKARLCLRGRALLETYGSERGVAMNRCGKWIVACGDAQVAGLHALRRQAEANGVSDLQWLSDVQAQALEPALRCEAALLSPSTGIVDSHGLMLALQGDLEHAGGAVVTRSAVESFERDGAGWRLQVRDAQGELSELNANLVINAAGLWAPRLVPASPPAIHYCKGSYFSLAGRAPFSRLIYPMPEPGGLGVHLTLDLGGQARFGPDVQWLDGVEDPAQIDYRVDPARAESFYAEIRRYWPALPDGALQPAYSGVRPKLQGPGQPASDFRIEGPAEHGLPGWVNLLGIESPGLTSCLAIAEYVVEEVLRRP